MSVCLHRPIAHFSVDSPSLGTRMFFSSWYSQGSFLLGNFVLFLGRKGKIGEPFREELFLKFLLLEMTIIPKQYILGWRILNAFISVFLHTFLSSSARWEGPSISQRSCKNSRAHTSPSFSQTWRKAWVSSAVPLSCS